MKPVDRRDALFVELHNNHLRPLGFKRRARRAARSLANGLSQHVILESSTWNTATRVEFGINLAVQHDAFSRDPSAGSRVDGGDFLVHISLRNYTDPPRHRWSLQLDSAVGYDLQPIRYAFAGTAMHLLARMSDLSTLQELCAEFGPFRFFEARSWCLRSLGRSAEAAEVIRGAVQHAPHPVAKEHAMRLLARYGA